MVLSILEIDKSLGIAAELLNAQYLSCRCIHIIIRTADNIALLGSHIYEGTLLGDLIEYIKHQ